MAWTIEYDPEAIKDLNKLSRTVRAEVYDYMTHRIAPAENPRSFGKALRYDKFGLWRYRVRDYRIVCELQDVRQVVLVVGRKYAASRWIEIGCCRYCDIN